MSNEGRDWARSTQGHTNSSQKFVLCLLGDYHNPEQGYAWPSQQRLSDDSGLSERQVRRHLARLQAQGFIERLQKGNQYRSSQYLLNLNVAAAVEGQSEPDIQGSEPDIQGK